MTNPLDRELSGDEVQRIKYEPLSTPTLQDFAPIDLTLALTLGVWDAKVRPNGARQRCRCDPCVTPNQELRCVSPAF